MLRWQPVLEIHDRGRFLTVDKSLSLHDHPERHRSLGSQIDNADEESEEEPRLPESGETPGGSLGERKDATL
jgi:hypothetical protein